MNPPLHQLKPGLPELMVVFAHPDDELLFFYHMIRWLRSKVLRLVCVTGNFRTNTGIRLAELAESCRQLGGELTNLGLNEEGQKSLDHELLAWNLARLDKKPGVPVLTHGLMGEYGHLHHVEVFRAVWDRFTTDTWCLSGPLPADLRMVADDLSYQQQLELLSTCYPSQPMIHSWACGEEELTHPDSNIFAALMKVDGLRANKSVPAHPDHLVQPFLTLLRDKYCRDQLPPVARKIANNWSMEKFQQRVEDRLAEWENRLVRRVEYEPLDQN